MSDNIVNFPTEVKSGLSSVETLVNDSKQPIKAEILAVLDECGLSEHNDAAAEELSNLFDDFANNLIAKYESDKLDAFEIKSVITENRVKLNGIVIVNEAVLAYNFKRVNQMDLVVTCYLTSGGILSQTLSSITDANFKKIEESFEKYLILN